MIELAYPAIYHFLFTSQLIAAMVTINISYSKKLSNLVKIYIKNAKYSGYNDNFRFKLAIFQDIYSKLIFYLRQK